MTELHEPAEADQAAVEREPLYLYWLPTRHSLAVLWVISSPENKALDF